jgi:hypothetical protein
MNNKEFFIKNPARALKSGIVQEPYVPEHQRLMAEGKLNGSPVEGELSAHQAQLRAQMIKEMQMAPKVTVPTVGQKDIAWNNRASFYDEPLNKEPIYDANLIREDLSNEELDKIYEELAKQEVNDTSGLGKSPNSQSQKEEYVPPTSLKQLNSNEIIIIVNSQVVFNSLDEDEIKNKLAWLIFEENTDPDNILVIKRLPVSISINIK